MCSLVSCSSDAFHEALPIRRNQRLVAFYSATDAAGPQIAEFGPGADKKAR